MDSYTKYLIMVGSFVTLITIIIFFIAYNYSGSASLWPSKTNECPDYWTKEITNNGIKCYDTLRMTPNDDDGMLFNPVDIHGNGKYWDGIPLNGDEFGTETAYYYRSELDGGDKGIPVNTGQWSTHCGKKKWAIDNGIAWNGITNSNKDCASYTGSSKGRNTIYDL